MDSDLESLLTSHIESGGGGGEGSNEERGRKGSEDGMERREEGRGVRKGESVSRPNNNANPSISNNRLRSRLVSRSTEVAELPMKMSIRQFI